jgi:SAM-dependent methyltransferase
VAAVAERAAAAEKVQQLFDSKAAAWAGKYAAGGPLAGRRAQLLAALSCNVSPAGDVLDLGCASGELARAMVQAGLRATACDISGPMLAQAAALSPVDGPAVDWVRLDPGWRVLPFAAGSFDAVVAFSVLEYVEDPAAVLAECRRVLRPGGVLLGTVPDLRQPVRWLEWLAARAARGPAAAAAGRRWPRMASYLTYLQVSRQRRPARWWRATAARAGLRPVTGAAREPRAALRLLAFRRPADGGQS